MIRIYAVVLNFISFATLAQYNETIRADRPGQALSAFTVGRGIFQVQCGFDYFGSHDALNKTTGVLNNTVIRYGITEHFEINSQFEYKGQRITQNKDTSRNTQRGVSATDLGIRYHIYEGKGPVPSVGFQFGTRLPVLGTDYKIKDLAPRFLIITSQQFSEKFSVNTVWGTAWNGNNSVPKYNYVINLSLSLSDRLGVFVENYGSVEAGVFTTYFDGGISWLLTSDLQLGLNGGLGSNLGVNNYFISAGVSWRTKRRADAK
jgi:hypothetical protein